MRVARSSWALAAGAVVFLALFAWQRSRSTFLRIEAEAALAHDIASRTGLRPAEVMALRELLGADLSPTELEESCERFHALASAGGDRARAWRTLRPLPEAFWGARFRANAERFGRRAAARR